MGSEKWRTMDWCVAGYLNEWRKWSKIDERRIEEEAKGGDRADE